jgi:aspartate kinase
MASLTGSVRILKFGGSSVASPVHIQRVAKIISAYKQQFPLDSIIVVVSAMGDTTDELIALAEKVSPRALKNTHRREMDMLLTSGERISMALLSMALFDLGLSAQSFTGSQSGIITDTVHGEARIAEIRPSRLVESLEQKKIAIVAGFQGVSREKEVTTLGRGGSDTSAVALGVALKACEVIIFTDVDGVYPFDPRKKSDIEIHAFDKISYQIAIEMGYRGAQVLHPRCIELAWKNNIPVRVKSSYIEKPENFLELESQGKKGKGTLVMGLEDSQKISLSTQSQIRDFSFEVKEPGAIALFQNQINSHGVRVLFWDIEKTNQIYTVKGYVERDHFFRLKEIQTPFQIQSDESELMRVSILAAGGMSFADWEILFNRAVEKGFSATVRHVISQATTFEVLMSDVQNPKELEAQILSLITVR